MRSNATKSDKKLLKSAKAVTPVKKKKLTELKSPVRDTIAETISFVIKGEITPIKTPAIVDKIIKSNPNKIQKIRQKKPDKEKVIKKPKIKTENVVVKTKKLENKPTPHKTTKNINTKPKVAKVLKPKNTPKVLSRQKIKVNDVEIKTKVKRSYKKLKPLEKSKTEKANEVHVSEGNNKREMVNRKEAKGGAAKPKTTVTKRIVKARKNFEACVVKKNAQKKKQPTLKNASKNAEHFEEIEIKKEKIEEELKSAEKEQPCLDSIKANVQEIASTDLQMKIKVEPQSDDEKYSEKPNSSACPSENKKLDDEKVSLKKTVKPKHKDVRLVAKKGPKSVTPKKLLIKNKLLKNKKKLLDRKRAAKLLSFWNGPKRHRVASLNAIAKVHCLYENESKGNILDKIDDSTVIRHDIVKKEATDNDNSDDSREKSPVPTRILRSVPGLRAVGKHWEMHDSTSSSEEDEIICKKEEVVKKSEANEGDKEQGGASKKRRRRKTELIMDLKDMVVRKRMASLNATAILAASYSMEKRPSKKGGDSSYDSDSSSAYFDDHSPTKKPLEQEFLTPPPEKTTPIIEEVKKEDEQVINENVVIVNQDTDVTITGVYVNSTTRSTHHEGYCRIAGMRYRISATSHTQTQAAAGAVLQPQGGGGSGGGHENACADSLCPVTSGGNSGKSYAPLDALSSMRPPPGPGLHHHHPHHHHHVAATTVLTPPPSQRCHALPPPPASSSAFSPTGHAYVQQEAGFSQGYYQPAGPLISVANHGGGPLAKGVADGPLAPPPISPPSPPPVVRQHPPPPSSAGDSSDSEVIITSVTTATKQDLPGPAPPSSSTHSYRYIPPPHQYPAQAGYPYSYPPAYAYPSPNPPPAYHEPPPLCYAPAPPHVKYAPPTTYRRYLTGYYPAPTNQHEPYGGAPPSGGSAGGPTQQVVAAPPPPTSTSSGAAYAGGGGPPQGPPLLDTYAAAPPSVEAYQAPHYYAYGLPTAPPPCYGHSPPTGRQPLPYINAPAAYQSCPCPMQSCPKNGLTGPLTGDAGTCKRSGQQQQHQPPQQVQAQNGAEQRGGAGGQLPLPPVALALPLEPASATGPPSPARGSAGMPRPPSQAGASYQPAPVVPPPATAHVPPLVTPPPAASANGVEAATVTTTMASAQKHQLTDATAVTKQETRSPTSGTAEGVEFKQAERKKARVGKAMVRNHIQNTMLLMCNPSQNIIKRELESPQEKEQKNEQHLSGKDIKNSAEAVEDAMKNNILKSESNDERISEFVTDHKDKEDDLEKTLIIEEPVTVTVAENVKVKNMKRKQSMSKDQPVPEDLHSSPKKPKLGSYKDFIKKDVNGLKINNGKKSLMEKARNNRTRMKMKKNTKRKFGLKLSTKPLAPSNLQNSKEDLKKAEAKSKLSNKTGPTLLDNLLEKNSVDRTIENVINCTSVRTNKTVKVNKCVKDSKSKNIAKVSKSEVRCRKVGAARRKSSKCKDETPEAVPKIPRRSLQGPRWSNGWMWEGEPYEGKVFLNSDETTVVRKCYPAMRHQEGDLLLPRDCVLLKAGPRKNDLPYVAKIAYLWENPDDGEMMMSLLWYYRPEHTEQGRLPSDQPDEVFASRHKDSNSVACIDDKCYVLTFNEYCRYKKRFKGLEEGIELNQACIPSLESYPRSNRQPPSSNISPEMVFFCRKVYDFRQKRIIKNPT